MTSLFVFFTSVSTESNPDAGEEDNCHLVFHHTFMRWAWMDDWHRGDTHTHLADESHRCDECAQTIPDVMHITHTVSPGWVRGHTFKYMPSFTCNRPGSQWGRDYVIEIRRPLKPNSMMYVCVFITVLYILSAHMKGTTEDLAQKWRKEADRGRKGGRSVIQLLVLFTFLPPSLYGQNYWSSSLHLHMNTEPCKLQTSGFSSIFKCLTQ